MIDLVFLSGISTNSIKSFKVIETAVNFSEQKSISICIKNDILKSV